MTVGLIERLYEAAANAGLLVSAEVAGRAVSVGFLCIDDNLLDGLVRSAAYTITYPLSLLPDLETGHTVVIAGQTYQVRDVRAIGDGTERRADLTRL